MSILFHFGVYPHLYVAVSIPKGRGKNEDAFCVHQNGAFLTVCDGVGSWSTIGVDPSLYSLSLAKETAACFASTASYDPKVLLQHAYEKSREIRGSSTVCVATLQRDGTFRAITVGDSVFFVIRDGCIVFRQKELQHRFNHPWQLGEDSSDKPSDGEHVTLSLIPNDVVIMCTDGVTDNLFDEHILDAVTAGGTPSEMASRIADMASAKSNSTSANTPFEKAARNAGLQFSGGKKDDITVIVARVSK